MVGGCRWYKMVFVLALVVSSCLYGILIYRNKLFPYRQLDYLYTNFVADAPGSYNDWAIGIYSGASPFDLQPSPQVINPILTAQQVTDADAGFVADPFLVRNDRGWQMFFEVFNRKSGQGEIGLALSKDGLTWEYGKIVLNETFHLSYPYVFDWNGDYYMTPESHQALAVRLYKALNYPDCWEYQGDLVRGYHFVDPCVINFAGYWWLFVATRDGDLLNLYYADQPTGPWHQHPSSPIVRNNFHTARPAGRPLVHNGKLYRFAQDVAPDYGRQLFAFEITTLTPDRYQERQVSIKPLLKGSGTGWNSSGMHHLDLQQLAEGEWLAVVDGWQFRVGGNH